MKRGLPVSELVWTHLYCMDTPEHVWTHLYCVDPPAVRVLARPRSLAALDTALSFSQLNPLFSVSSNGIEIIYTYMHVHKNPWLF